MEVIDSRFKTGEVFIDKTYARQIGADGYAADAGESVDIAKELLK